MGQVFFENLTGANCNLSGQAIISLQVSEDADADYDTASAVALGWIPRNAIRSPG